MKGFRKHLSYANVASMIAISAALTGSAYAAASFTSNNVQNGSITGADVKNGSIAIKDLSSTAMSSLRGPKGARGATGERGPTGPQGPTGDAGDAGGSAHSIVRYARRNLNYVTAAPDGTAANTGDQDWDAPNYGGGTNYPNLANVGAVAITSNEPSLVQLTGNNNFTTGTIRPSAAGQLTATATLTVMHSNMNESDTYVGGDSLHGRIRCTLRYADNGEPINKNSAKLGSSEWVSTFRRHKVETFTITGSKEVSGGPTADYNVGITCADWDSTVFNQWWFLSGSITAHSIYVES